ncbi:MAG: phosphoglycerate dehydrogenase [Firmicutes bacterium]|nr:phosphoglycerate dehydrogenase [Candidatus Colimorpha enterica]
MYKVKLLNKIAKIGLNAADPEKYVFSENEENPDAILVRSAKMHDMEFPKSLLAIGRAGAGVNNIPLDRCAENGIVVFNTPGANANGVKELAIAALLLASRNITGGIEWAKSHQGEIGVAALAEKEKSKFAGNEIEGKSLGVIGLGAIGGLVANAAKNLGMKVYGCDPYITVEAAWGLSRSVEKAATYEDIFKNCDYITLHVPATKDTTGMINAETIEKMKDGVKIINLARAELVDSQAIIAAVKSGKIGAYVTDFITDDLIGVDDRIICIPHLGASTEESEDKCAVMAVNEIAEYLENGNIKNSVNFPNAILPHDADSRICIMHKNVAGVISKISLALASGNINIENMINRSKGDYAYTIVEVIGGIPDEIKAKLSELEEVIRLRFI